MANNTSNNKEDGPGSGPIKNYVPDRARIETMEQRLLAIRLKLLFKEPFWGQLVTGLDLVDASGWCGTAATDGRHFYYNVDFIDSLNEEEMIFLFAHEVMHVVYSHMSNVGGKDRKLHNIAADFVINGELVECGIGKMPEDGCYDKKFLYYDDSTGDFMDTWTSDEIYHYLYDNADQAEGKGPLDEHIDLYDENQDGEDGDGDGDGSGEYRPGDANSKPGKMTAKQREEMQANMQNDLLQAAKAQIDHERDPSKSAGHMPGGIRRMIRELLEPKIRWQDLIETSLKSQIKSDYTYMRPNRRGNLPGGIIMAGWDTEEMIEAHVAIDTSGSMGDNMLQEIMSELKGIMDKFTSYSLHVWCFDGVVWEKSYKIFTPDNLEDISNYELLGGGGTLFEANWEWMKENDIEPKTLLLFTDGYPCDSWGDPVYCDTIFCVHGDNSRSLKAPYGLTIYYEDGKG